MKNKTLQIPTLEALIAGIRNKLGHLAFMGLMLCLVHSASAQDYRWTGLGYNGLWADPTNWTPVGVPPSEAQGLSTNGGNLWLQPPGGAASGQTTITITNGEAESPGVHTNDPAVHPPWNTVYGPESGMTLNIYGSLTYDWIMAAVQANPAPGLRTHINLYTNSTLTTAGAGVGLGNQWWYFAAPYVTMNMYGNALLNLTNGAGLYLGGRLNIYDTAILSLSTNGYVDFKTQNAISDGTRSLVLGGGRMVLPTAWGTTVTNWVTRAILRPYGKSQSTNDLVITDDGTNTIGTPVPLGGALQQIYFQPLLRSTMTVGMFQQAVLVGDYPSVTGVLLSSEEPGLNPTVTGRPVYTSSNTGVATVDTNGLVRAVGPGTATLSATLGAFTSLNTVSVSVVLDNPSLIHRYSFSEASGTTTADSVGGPSWAGTLGAGASLGGGQVTLGGSYVQLPAGLVSGLNEVTIEGWASFGSPVNTNSRLWALGDTDGTVGLNYITLLAKTTGGGISANMGQGNPGSGAQRSATGNRSPDGQAGVQIVAVYHPLAGYEAIYTNGVLAATQTIFNNMIDPVAYAGPTYTNGSILAYTLGANPWNLLGYSLNVADPAFNGSIDEFRIYNGPLTAGRIKADYLLGPNALIGTTTNVSLTVTLSGSNVLLDWPTNSALVNLLSTPALGPTAAWTAVSGSLAIVGGNYEMTVPISGAARYFRLSE